ncbi:MAG TPA: hypothetical protein VGA37_10300 [Gemmatimonadales bacterium]
MPHVNVAPVASRTLPVDSMLDPADWEAFGALAHRMLDDMLRETRTVRDRPVWRPVPESTRARFEGPVPERGIGAERAYEDFCAMSCRTRLGIRIPVSGVGSSAAAIRSV